MLSLLVTLLVLVLVFGVIWWLIGFLGLPAPFGKVAQVLIALIFIVILLGVAFGGISVPVLRG